MRSLTIRHVTTYRYRRAVAFGEHRMMLHPRNSHHQRVVQADLKISPKPRSLRFVQDAFGNHVGIARFSRRSTELSFESIVRLEHSPREITLDLEDADGPSPSAIASLSCATSPLTSPTARSDGRGWAMGWAIPAPKRVDRRFRVSHAVVTRHPSPLPLQAAGGEGRPAADRDASARPWKLPRLRYADDRRGALDWSGRAFCVRVSRHPLGRSAGADGLLRSRINSCLGANLSAGRRMD